MDQPGDPTSFLETHRRDYAEQVRRLLLVRVVIILVCLAILLIYEEGRPRLLAGAHVAMIVATAVSAVHLFVFRWVRNYERFVIIGLGFDFLFATALCYLTGGILNAGSTVLFFATILEAVLFVSDRAGFYVASAATVALAAIAVVYWFANQSTVELPAVAPALYEYVPLRWGRVIGNLIAVLVAYHGVALLASRLPYRVSTVRILYDEVIERLREGLVAIDKRGHIVLVNREACRLLNWSHPGSLLGRRFEEVLRRKEDRTVLEVLARGTDVQAELSLTIRGRTPMDVEVTTTVLNDSNGQVRGVVGIFRDLSLKRRLEEMERRVARLSCTEEVAMGIAHEIRTPLASIRGSVQELTRSLPADASDRKLGEIVRRESDRLDRLLPDFLDYARMRPPLSGPVDLGLLCAETVELLKLRPNAAGVTITCAAPAKCVVQGDGDQLRQALMNIGVNAIDALAGAPARNDPARSAERGRLEIVFSDVQLPQRSEGPERRLEARDGIEVAFDNDGPRIALVDAERIFTPFFTTKQGGLGLGLAITQKIIRMHGGTVVCDDGGIGGACFRIQLPLTKT